MDFKRLLKPKIIIPTIAGIFILIPIIQNMQRVFLQFYFWEVRISQSLIILCVFILGFGAGYGFVYLLRFLKKKKADKEV